jgi:outer membrane receptor protein involved in Fe transport
VETHNLKLNADYAADAQNRFSFELIGNIYNQDTHEPLYSKIFRINNVFKSNSYRLSEEYEHGNESEGALSYTHRFNNKKEKFSLSVNSSIGHERQNTDITNNTLNEQDIPISNAFLQRTHDYEILHITNAKVDYTLPIGSNALIETGYKSTFRKSNSDILSEDFIGQQYVTNAKAYNLFNYSDQTHAVYFNYSDVIGDTKSPNLTYSAGLRGEYTTYHGVNANQSVDFMKNYLKLFPSANLAYHNNENDLLKISYSRRINRPSFVSLNPFIDITDSLNPHGGNPYLKPELIHSFELGYSKKWKSMTYISSIYYRHTTDIISRFISLFPNGVALITQQNYGKGITYGIEQILTGSPINHLNTNLSLSLYKQHIDGSNVSTDAIKDLVSWYCKWINSYVIGKTSKVQLTANYISPIATAQGTRIAVYNVDMGFQKKLFNNKAALALVVTDIFNIQNNGFTTKTSDFNFHRTGKVDTRAILLTITYSFRSKAKEELLENKFEDF